MSSNVTWPPIGGSTYSIPSEGEVGWEDLSDYLIALSGSQGTTNQKVGQRVASTSPVTVSSAGDCVVITDLSVAGAVTVNLPAGVNGQVFMIKDGKGDGATNNITINRAGADTIDGATTYVIDQNYGSVLIVFNGSNWSVIAANADVPTSLNLVAGSAASPSLAFQGASSNTGLYLVSADSLGFSADGTNVGSYTSTGQWTIGPAAGPYVTVGVTANRPFHSYANSASAQASLFENAGAGTAEVIIRGTGGGVLRFFNGATEEIVFRSDTGVAALDIEAAGSVIGGYVSGSWRFGLSVPANPANVPYYFYVSNAAAQQARFENAGAGTQEIVIRGTGGGALRFFNGGTEEAVLRTDTLVNGLSFEAGGTEVASYTSSGLWTIGPNGGGVTHRINTNTAGTATAGAATLPANPQGFITININGTDRTIPYYQT